MNKKLLIMAAVPLSIILINSLKRNRKVWVKPWLQRRREGRDILSMVENELKTEDPDAYKNFLRMTESQFNTLLELIRPDIEKIDTHMRESISAEKRLAVTLRFLATGETFKSLKYATRIHDSTISLIIPEVCEAIYKNLKDEYLKFPQNSEEWEDIAELFKNRWNFPMCLGAIDGKHINFRPPKSSGSYYYNYKGNNSIVLLGVADANYKFLYVDVGVNGRVSDGGVFRESSLKKAIDLNISFPPDKILLNNAVPYTFIADEAFPLSKRILKPYANRGLTNEKRIFNYRLSRGRNVIENTFGILSNRFRILLNTMNLDAPKVEIITLTCCVLHNYLAENPSYMEIEQWNANLQNFRRIGGNRATTNALGTREEFCSYFNGVGAVPWQYNILN